MMTPLLKQREAIPLMLMAAVFIAIGVVRLPLQAVLLVAIPASVVTTFTLRRKVAA